MGELANAIAEVVAAFLRTIGFVGRPRRRAAIRADLELLREVEAFPEFAPGSWPRTWLANHITMQVAEFSGLDLRTSRRNIPWSAVILSVVIWAPLGWLTFHLVDIGHAWYALLPALPAAVMFVATLGMLAEKEEVVPDGGEDTDQPEEADGAASATDAG